jgi:hypothetical protein
MIGQLTSYVAVCAAVIVFAAACGSPAPAPTEGEESPGFQRFKDTVAPADEDGYTPYWLGRSFSAGGLAFDGPYVAEGATVRGGGVEASYRAVTADGKGVVVLDVYSFSQAAWELRMRRGGPAITPGTVSRSLVVAGRDARMQTFTGARPVELRRLVLEFDDAHGTTVEVRAYGGGALVEGGPDVNPLVDEATFLSVVENLRPYPE